MALSKIQSESINLADTFAFTGTVSGAISFAVVSDQKTSGTAGGTPPSTGFETRDLNTEVFDPDGIVTVSSNQFTLIAGTYIIDWECPHYRGNSATSVLYDITGTATVETSTSGYDFTTSGMTVGLTTGRARVVITSNNTYEIRMKVSAAYASVGYGVAANGNPETYTTVRIMKIG